MQCPQPVSRCEGIARELTVGLPKSRNKRNLRMRAMFKFHAPCCHTWWVAARDHALIDRVTANTRAAAKIATIETMPGC
jgi:hypothetical protein